MFINSSLNYCRCMCYGRREDEMLEILLVKWCRVVEYFGARVGEYLFRSQDYCFRGVGPYILTCQCLAKIRVDWAFRCTLGPLKVSSVL